MVDRLPLGPYRVLRTAEGVDLPWYMIPFDDQGRCTGPRTRSELVARAGAEGFSDIIVFSHGWNNDWVEATGHYERFLNGYMGLRQRFRLPPPPGFRPLLVGIFWPSKLLVGRDEQAPAIAADEVVDEEVAEEQEQVAELAGAIPADDVPRFYELMQQEELDEAEALELAKMLAPLYATDTAETGEQAAPDPEQIAASWQVQRRRRRRRGGDAGDFGTRRDRDAGPQAAGVLDFLRPREIVRGASVWLMKDRAGRVGARGVGPLLTDLLAGDARVHTVGHSYGAKVVLSAITAPSQLPKPVHSALLLQPAISHLCFAADAGGTGRPGGYRPALQRIQLPILSTFSQKDFPLTKTFHWALRRDSDIGDAQIAGDEPPNRYAALGGFGPRGLGGAQRLIKVQDPVDRYDLTAPGIEIYGIDATRTISGHGEISSESTWWMLYNMVAS